MNSSTTHETRSIFSSVLSPPHTASAHSSVHDHYYPHQPGSKAHDYNLKDKTNSLQPTFFVKKEPRHNNLLL